MNVKKNNVCGAAGIITSGTNERYACNYFTNEQKFVDGVSSAFRESGMWDYSCMKSVD